MMKINRSCVAILVATLVVLLSASSCHATRHGQKHQVKASSGHNEHQYRKAVASAEAQTRQYLRQLVSTPTQAPVPHPKAPPKKKNTEHKKKKKVDGGSGGGEGESTMTSISAASSGGGSSGAGASTGGSGGATVAGGSSSSGGGNGGSSSSSGGGGGSSISDYKGDGVFSPADSSDKSVNLPSGAMGHGDSKSILGVLSAAIGVGFLVAGAAFMRQRDFVDRELDSNHNHRLKGSVKQRMMMMGHILDRHGSRNRAAGSSNDSLSSSSKSMDSRTPSSTSVSSSQKSKKNLASRMSSAAKKKLTRQLSRTKSARQSAIENDIENDDISMDVYSVTGDDGGASLGPGMLVV